MRIDQSVPLIVVEGVVVEDYVVHIAFILLPLLLEDEVRTIIVLVVVVL